LYVACAFLSYAGVFHHRGSSSFPWLISDVAMRYIVAWVFSGAPQVFPDGKKGA
jgi:hypothetical protein